VAFVRLDDPDMGPGTVLEVACMDAQTHSGEVCELPFYDQAGDIARGRATELPEIPTEG
jgi:aminomethyltransferase